MKVSVTIDFTDDVREAINKYDGREGLATREECKNMLKDAFDTHLSDILENVELNDNPAYKDRK